MKKIISLVCVIAMLFAFAVTVNAADNEVNLVVKEQTAEATVLALNIKSATTVASYSFYIDVANAVNAGATVTAAITNGTKAQYNAQQKMVAISYSPTDGTMLDAGEMELATITITALDAAYDVSRKAESSRTKTVITYKADAGSIAEQVQANFTFATDVTVAPFAAEEEFVPETIKGDAIAATATDIVLPKSEGSENTHRFTNVAIFNAEIGAAVKYSETGFIWVANGNETENKFTLDGEAISGGGTFAYSVIMAGIPDDVTITAKPYYVTAE